MWCPDIPPETLTPILQTVEASPHPRLFATESDFRELRRKCEENDGIHRRMRDRIVHLADGLLAVPPAERVKVGRRLLAISRLEVYRISTLALAYRMTGNPAYRDRCIEELRAIARFEDWNPSHFLDVGEMTLAVSTGYDWLYGELSEEDRALIGTAILEKGLRSSDDKAWWRKARNNWGQVCHTGMMAGALAVMERAPEICRRQMAESLRDIALPMQNYGPGGNYPEGPGYWNYGTGYNALGLSILESACGTDFGLSDAPGFRETGFYNDLLRGPSGMTYFYADCRYGRALGTHAHPVMAYGIPWWFARHFHNPAYVERSERTVLEEWCAKRNDVKPEKDNGWFRAYAFFWIFDPEGGTTENLPLVWNPQGPIPIAVVRTSWDDAKATYFGIKAGTPRWSHGHMDCGSFVLDALGERWFDDLGAEEYHRIEQMGINLWDGKQEGDRWKLFRLNNYSHNTLTLGNRLQRVDAMTRIVSVDTAADGTVAIVADFTEAYADVCAKAIRKAVVSPSGELLLEDHLEGLPVGLSVSWRACTAQTFAGMLDNAVRLRGTRSTMLVENLSGVGDWKIVDVAEPQPAFPGDSPNPGVSQLQLETEAPESGVVDLKVRFHVEEKSL